MLASSGGGGGGGGGGALEPLRAFLAALGVPARAVSLESLHGGMRHSESSGAVNIPYQIESLGFDPGGINADVTSSVAMNGTPVVIANVSSWQNILANLGIRYGELDLNFPNPAEYNVAGTYGDELTITLSASL